MQLFTMMSDYIYIYIYINCFHHISTQILWFISIAIGIFQTGFDTCKFLVSNFTQDCAIYFANMDAMGLYISAINFFSNVIMYIAKSLRNGAHDATISYPKLKYEHAFKYIYKGQK